MPIAFRLPARWPGSLLACLLLALPVARTSAQAGTLRGTVSDTAGRPLANVEVLSVNAERSARTGQDGRFILTRLPFGQQLIIARLPGYQPGDRPVNMLDESTPEIAFRLRRVVQAIDTVRIVSQDGCAAYDYAGFECRRRAGIGQFRSAEELGALRPSHWADMFAGLPGFKRKPIRHEMLGTDWIVESTTGWRCLKEGYNGKERTAAETRVLAKDIAAIEHYEVYEKVPAAYKRLAWPTNQDKPCALVMYWTKEFVDSKKR